MTEQRTVVSSGAIDPDALSPRLAHMYAQFADSAVEASQMVATTAVLRAFRIVTARIEIVLSKFDLTMSQFEILGLLNVSSDGTLAFAQVKNVILLHPATMTYTADALEKRKLIARVPSPSDRRAVNAKITSAGRAVTASAIEALDAVRFGVGEWDSQEALDAAILLSKLHS